MIATTPPRSADARRAEVVELGEGWSASVAYGFLSWPGQDRPRFTIAINYTQEGARRFGAYFDLLKKHFPNLADLIPWNLCDADGLPSNYVDGADYWYELVCGRGVYAQLRLPEGCASFADALARHLRCAESGDRVAMDSFLAGRRLAEGAGHGAAGRATFVAWLEARRPLVRAAMREAMRRHGIEEVVVEAPRGDADGLLGPAD